jgi:hypothetical protein
VLRRFVAVFVRQIFWRTPVSASDNSIVELLANRKSVGFFRSRHLMQFVDGSSRGDSMLAIERDF